MLGDLLKSVKILLADGATGTNLFAMGLAAGEAPEVWNFEHPERVRALHPVSYTHLTLPTNREV